MIVQPLKTPRIEAGSTTLLSLLDSAIGSCGENSIIVITSKIVSLCEGRVVPLGAADKQELIQKEAQYLLPASASKYGLQMAITQNTLIAAAGIDESNGGDNYILWPANPQKSANQAREFLINKFGISNLGVVITDSTCMPLRLGTVGIAIAHSGFRAINNYVGQEDLFGRKFEVSQSNVAGGIAAAAVVVMGEGTEQTPLAIVEDVPFVEFQYHDPTDAEIANLTISKEDDLFAPFLEKADWLEGDQPN